MNIDRDIDLENGINDFFKKKHLKNSKSSKKIDFNFISRIFKTRNKLLRKVKNYQT